MSQQSDHERAIAAALAECAAWDIPMQPAVMKKVIEAYLRDRPSLPIREKCEAIINEASFLLDRLSDLEWSDVPDEFYRDWNGHVEPSLSRLRGLVALRQVKEQG